ncbi:cell division septum initiation protein DivIVA [Streptacidiphilus sp. MAP12-16]|uniref:hypothetical protein n=1 Tax=Streptacidiphilus sp. MAP12-16 TaxID=3156300 RepID=UPI003515FECA
MSDAVSPHGFTVTRRGYDPDQVEHSLARLTAERDAAWERLSGLGHRMRALEQKLLDAAEAERAAQAAAEADPPSYLQLSDRAARMLVLAEEEAVQLRSDAEEWTESLDTRTRADAQQFRANAEGYAAQQRRVAEEAHRRELDRARAQAEAERADADRESRAVGEAADEYVVGRHADAEAAAEAARVRLVGLQHDADQEQAATDARGVAWEHQVTAGADRKRTEAERHHKAMQAKAAEIDAEAATQAERILEAAQREAARIAAAAEREQALFTQHRDELQAHLEHIRTTLTTLTGAPDESESQPESQPEPDGSESDTDEIPVVQAPSDPQPVDNASPDEP